MKFSLQQKAGGTTGLVTFSVLDEKNVVRGTVSVPNAEADSLTKCWCGTFKPLARPAKPTADKMAKALLAQKRAPRTPAEIRQAALRGS